MTSHRGRSLISSGAVRPPITQGHQGTPQPAACRKTRQIFRSKNEMNKIALNSRIKIPLILSGIFFISASESRPRLEEPEPSYGDAIVVSSISDAGRSFPYLPRIPLRAISAA